jgi:regulator of CtrA degradation
MPQPQTQTTASVFLMPGLFNQTVQLLLEARDYFEHEGRVAEAHLDFFHRPFFTAEMSRITLRLSYVMAWLSVQKAVLAGDISREEAMADYPLDGLEICLETNITAEHILPVRMNHLLEQSLSLYERVHRLDKQFNE